VYKRQDEGVVIEEAVLLVAKSAVHLHVMFADDGGLDSVILDAGESYFVDREAVVKANLMDQVELFSVDDQGSYLGTLGG